jgi:hypothetical protein
MSFLTTRARHWITAIAPLYREEGEHRAVGSNATEQETYHADIITRARRSSPEPPSAAPVSPVPQPMGASDPAARVRRPGVQSALALPLSM